MPTRKIMVDGVNVEVEDTTAEIIQKFVKDAEEKAKTDMERLEEMEDEIKSMKQKLDEAEKEQETSDAKIATLEQSVKDAELTPEKLDAAVKQRAEVIDAAKAIKSDVVVDGKSEADIRREVVADKMGEKAKDWTDEQIAASFNTLADSAGEAPAFDPYQAAHKDKHQDGKELRGRALYIDRLEHPQKYRSQAH